MAGGLLIIWFKQQKNSSNYIGTGMHGGVCIYVATLNRIRLEKVKIFDLKTKTNKHLKIS